MLRSLYARLAAVFLLLLLGLGAALAVWSARSSIRLVEAADQAIHRDLAADLAPRFQMYLDDGIPRDSLEAIIEGLSSVNRRIDVYLLDSTGMVKAALRMPGGSIEGRTVDTRPLERVIAGAATFPVLGDDPRRPGAHRPFSAAYVRIMGEEGCYLYVTLGNEAYDAHLAALARGMWMRGARQALPLALLVTAVLGLLLFASVTRPLRRLTEAAQAVERGELDRRVPVAGGEEVASLGASFNRMAAALADTLRKLERTDRERRDLVANVSHDLRSPLAAVRGYLETVLLKGDDFTPEKRQEYLEVALRNTEGLGALVEELFELSKLEAGGVTLQQESFAAADLVQDTAARFRPRAESDGQHLVLCLDEGLPLVCGDLRLVERVIANLADNALRYTPPGGTVELAALRAPGGATIHVRDTGAGIAPDLIGRVTERFVQGDPARTRGGRGGAGLGLAIAERIIELHGSLLQIESPHGKGTTISFFLPADAVCE
jgi:signal transduction histidine kinase